MTEKQGKEYFWTSVERQQIEFVRLSRSAGLSDHLLFTYAWMTAFSWHNSCIFRINVLKIKKEKKMIIFFFFPEQ